MTKALSLRLIREKSKRLKIPYQNIIVGCGKEWILDQIFSRESNFSIFLKRSPQIGLAAYQSGCDKVLNLASMEELQNVREELNTIFDGIKIQEKEDHLEAIVKVPFDRLELEIEVRVFPAKEKKTKIYKYPLHLIYENERSVDVACYYQEADLAELFCMLYEKMELLTEVDILEVIFLYATTKNLSGKYLSLYMEEKLNCDITDKGRQQLEKAMESKALQARYKGYLRSQKRVEPSYERVKVIIKRLFFPILESMEKEEIFFGDWMPEVERYL